MEYSRSFLTVLDKEEARYLKGHLTYGSMQRDVDKGFWLCPPCGGYGFMRERCRACAGTGEIHHTDPRLSSWDGLSDEEKAQVIYNKKPWEEIPG